jgi:2-phosphosulfolactate phosphatase
MDYVLNVYGLPSATTPEELRDATVVVIDVLRASTTMIFALEAGAREIVPCLEVEDARQAAAELPAGEAVLGGERGGVRIEGFHLGNSPTEYTMEAVSGRTVVFTTTNGTRALLQCRQARRVLIGAFVNASAVLRELAGQERIDLVCAGTGGDYSRDDILVAGFLVERLQKMTGHPYKLNVQALTARENWVSSFAVPYATGAELLPPEKLAVELRKSLGGQNLTAVGLDADILTASQIDHCHAVPELDLTSFHVRLPQN